MRKGLDFIAIDFETANSNRASVCQIGVAKVIGGVITKTYCGFIKPPAGHNEFTQRCVEIHGITGTDVAEAPSWSQTLERLKTFTLDGALPLVAHSAAVERSCILQASKADGVQSPEFELLCSLTLARRRLASPRGYGLKALTELLGLPTFDHHHAGADAIACAELVLEVSRRSKIEDLRSLWELSS